MTRDAWNCVWMLPALVLLPWFSLLFILFLLFSRSGSNQGRAFGLSFGVSCELHVRRRRVRAQPRSTSHQGGSDPLHWYSERQMHVRRPRSLGGWFSSA